MKSSLIDRRSFAKAAGLGFLATLLPRQLQALERAEAVYAAGFRAPNGEFGLATVSVRGEVIDRIDLPSRAHGLAYCRTTGRGVAFARRPGTFAMIFDPAGQAEPVVIHAPEGRHFYGHGHFSPDGRILYASENDFDARRGVIGLYDATNGFQRIGEFDACGMGTHDMIASDDGTLLIIANGGIETHPDFGRTKLNLDRMEPSLAILDARDGSLVQRHTLPTGLSRLSTRHLALDASNRVWFACQWEGARNALPPLAGFFAPGEDLTFLDLPQETTQRLANYVGAIAINREEKLVGLTSPIGGAAVIIDAASGRVLAEEAIPEAAGVAASPTGLAVSSYTGRLCQTQSDLAFDQHLIRIG
ncbi:DUF1513 domain-containing protein [Rhizobium sp. SSA_523]|uniref:DUF1513 domain-containing protein n=1 Tax=Rhizobium sp. SSA_523 TaxID=2952477 RepID=UPI002090DDC3|nr:DUF1513 domain-containing protein [Rhizobium sp. SSA_523]MCO5732717.1 DUF1513 domain-containing protein [Rhizobium sp. SSA_523]WKC23659.1 DUF1513 domain-containing protein [Rhizobium sp. SSA_523]